MVNVSVGTDGRVVHVGNRFVPDLAAATAGQDASRRASDAAAAAARHVGLAPTEPLVVVDTEGGATRETTLSDGGVSAQPIPAELSWLPVDGGVRLAWTVEIEPTDGEHWWTVRVDAETGAVLRADDLIVHDDPAAIASAIARPAGAPAAIGPDETVDDGSSYRVFPLPMESPSDGDRALVRTRRRRWRRRSAGTTPMATRGAGVHPHPGQQRPRLRRPGQRQRARPGHGSRRRRRARLRLPARPRHDGHSTLGTRPSPTSSIGTTSSTTSSTSTASTRRQGTSRSTTTDSGGLGADDVRAEAQDGSGRNNANFGTPVDGLRPRMQMFEWRSALAQPDRGAPALADRRHVLRPDGGLRREPGDYRADQRRGCLRRARLRSRVPGRAAARSLPGRPRPAGSP